MGSPRLINLVRLATARAKGSWGGMGGTGWKGQGQVLSLIPAARLQLATVTRVYPKERQLPINSLTVFHPAASSLDPSHSAYTTDKTKCLQLLLRRRHDPLPHPASPAQSRLHTQQLSRLPACQTVIRLIRIQQ
jgi:hypothetical protein